MSLPYPILTPEEAAALIQNGETIGFSGFTPAGSPKAIPRALAERAKAEHAPAASSRSASSPAPRPAASPRCRPGRRRGHQLPHAVPVRRAAALADQRRQGALRRHAPVAAAAGGALRLPGQGPLGRHRSLRPDQRRWRRAQHGRRRRADLPARGREGADRVELDPPADAARHARHLRAQGSARAPRDSRFQLRRSHRLADRHHRSRPRSPAS